MLDLESESNGVMPRIIRFDLTTMCLRSQYAETVSYVDIDFDKNNVVSIQYRSVVFSLVNQMFERFYKGLSTTVDAGRGFVVDEIVQSFNLFSLVQVPSTLILDSTSAASLEATLFFAQ
ncbi:hypothetical protein V9T40_014673 [Parthenolecanium corni]|uniref:Uncharacterized protein n=1 Tax=Parthenolecanium corni TaxID=536013 RepID=A0AAN9XWL8_9HEMI